jgi:hypothetical protein
VEFELRGVLVREHRESLIGRALDTVERKGAYEWLISKGDDGREYA